MKLIRLADPTSARRFREGLGAALLLVAAGLPTSAQTPGSSLATNYSANANKPINIELDSLEVDDKKKVAVFKGNVLATQGDFNLRSTELYVTYTSKSNSDGANGGSAQAQTASGNAASAASVLPGGNSEITQIDAKGDVRVTTKDQTATGSWAKFEVQKQLVTLGGDVVVSQGTNAIKGDRLVIDLKTSLSRFENDTANNEKGKKARIIGVFTPKSQPNLPGIGGKTTSGKTTQP